MAKKPLDLINEMARPKKPAYDPDDPKNTKNAKPQATGPASDPFNTKKRLGKVIKYAAGVIAADVARIAGTKTTGRGRPSKAAAEEKVKKGKSSISKFSDKESESGKRVVTLHKGTKTLNLGKLDIETFDKAFKKIFAKGADDEVQAIRTKVLAWMEKNNIDDTDEIDVKFGDYEASDRASNYERTDPAGGEHTQVKK